MPDSAFTATTNGGALLVFMDLSLDGGSHSTCQPIVDGVWAGSYGNLPANGDPYWKEGLMATGCCGGGWRKWTTTRLYPGIPAGTHTFAVQCATDGGTVKVCGGGGTVGCSWGFIEVQ